jgi:hypothetical protein
MIGGGTSHQVLRPLENEIPTQVGKTKQQWTCGSARLLHLGTTGKGKKLHVQQPFIWMAVAVVPQGQPGSEPGAGTPTATASGQGGIRRHLRTRRRKAA